MADVEKTLTKILEVRDNGESTWALSLENPGGCPSGVLVEKKNSARFLKYLQRDQPIVAETRGPLSTAGSQFIALYAPGEGKPFYTNPDVL